ncbi:LytTR family DNA-binding domain-containing protein [Caulobacter segnis]|uniref:LytTR family DNA-binding domain-containing protein n=1 Tax=Caulobacter segnis TaxID=88688 RepID=UPI001CBF8B7F|nr:LytTR family DNA-binding domain-containing protein [Caulobacter segnis]UAL10087.1 LytTR family transcriptional regulator [Caulobacter segnis]
MLAVAVIGCAYTVTIFVARDDTDLGAAFVGGIANTIPVILFGGLVRRFIIEKLVGRSAIRQTLGHAVLCTAFSVLSFWVLIILLGMANGASPFAFEVKPFGKGSAWQLLENATTYAVIAALSYLQAWRPISNAKWAASEAEVTLPAPPSDREVPRKRQASRHFIRSGEDILPVDVSRVVCITGADDYSDVATLDRNHLVRMTLAEFEKSLDAAIFVRVHRSSIVNVDLIERAEPAGGGRMLLHMANGQAIQSSRAGARLLRARII